MPLVVVILPKTEKSQQVFNEHELLGLAIRVEAQKNSRLIGQCHRCQKLQKRRTEVSSCTLQKQHVATSARSKSVILRFRRQCPHRRPTMALMDSVSTSRSCANILEHWKTPFQLTKAAFYDTTFLRMD
ncbi:unnamed protein product [Acanthoscelides obtectus]|uniref:Uncharacterized protein n=1 Tax=Acanthoscelides obtectus TaxID=200917 RepID=A0A9P0JS83_ACAOB|nr:unnamed protein product [Acanthoscelides obtectus]CAK1663843.1 hypothetical protein AOBTE_LOCUS23889 [Acanthoscelides obtectus]